MIGQVVEVGAKLNFEPLIDGGHLADRKIKIPVVGSQQRVASFVPEMAGAGNAGIREAVGWLFNRAGNRKGIQLQKLRWIAVVVVDRRNHIGAVEKFAATTIVVFKRIIQAEWMTAHYCENSAHLPTVTQFPDPLPFRKIVGNGPNQAIAYIEV